MDWRRSTRSGRPLRGPSASTGRANRTPDDRRTDRDRPTGASRTAHRHSRRSRRLAQRRRSARRDAPPPRTSAGLRRSRDRCGRTPAVSQPSATATQRDGYACQRQRRPNGYAPPAGDRYAGDAAPTATPAPTAPPVDSVTGIPTALIPLEPDRDPRAAPVVDWQARWSSDGEVLGVWIADSAGSSWGRLAVLAADPATEMVTGDNQLMPDDAGPPRLHAGRESRRLGRSVGGQRRRRVCASGRGALMATAACGCGRPSQEEVTPAS